MTELYNGINISNFNPALSTPVKELDGVSIAASSSADFTLSGSELDGYSGIVVTVKATYNASATSGARVLWLYSQDGSNYDAEVDAENAGNYEDLSFTAGGTAQRTILIPILAPYVKVEVLNKDSSYALTADAWALMLR